jgi:hypothetical protein
VLVLPVQETQQVKECRERHNNPVQFATDFGLFLFGPGEFIGGSIAAVGLLDCEDRSAREMSRSRNSIQSTFSAFSSVTGSRS